MTVVWICAAAYLSTISPFVESQRQQNVVALSLSPSPIALANQPLPSPPTWTARDQSSLPPLRPIERIEKVASIGDSLAKIIAVIAAAVFGYWKFLHGRVFHPRLETSISVSARVESGRVFLEVLCKLKNVGLSKVDLDRKLSAIRLFFCTPGSSDRLAKWPQDALFAVDAFANHEWIESGETIEDSHVFIFDNVVGQLCRAELRVFRKRFTIRQRIQEWKRRRSSPTSWTQHVLVTQEKGSSTAVTNPNKI